MTSPLLLIAGILALGVVFVVAPVVLETLQRYRRRKVVTCPADDSLAEVTLNTRRAALGAAFGHPLLRVKSCSLWPKKMRCAEKCTEENWPTP